MSDGWCGWGGGVSANKASAFPLFFLTNTSHPTHPTHSLDPAFRLAYASLWDALLAGDVPAILSSARAMHAGEAAPLFASMLTLKPWRAISDAGNKGQVDRLAAGAADAEEAREYASNHAADINALLGRVPREILLLLKTADCLRSIDRSLDEVRGEERMGWGERKGGVLLTLSLSHTHTHHPPTHQTTNTFVVTADVVARALAAAPGAAPRGWRRAARARVAVTAARAAGWARRWRRGAGQPTAAAG